MRTNLVIYAYRINLGSITKKPNIKNIKDIIKSINIMIEYINNLKFLEKYRKIVMKTVSTLFYKLTSIYSRLADKNK